VLVHLGQGAVVDEGADGDAFVQAVAGLEAADPVGEHGQELLRDRAVHEDPVRADAGLAGVQELDQRRAASRVRRIGIGEHDERRVPAKLQRDPLDRGRGALGQHLADLRRAGEGQLAHHRVADELIAHHAGPGRGDQVDHAGRHAHLVQDAEHLHRAQRRLLSRFEHDRAAGREGGSDLPGQHGDRVVPRGDRADHAHRLVQDHEPLVGPGRRDRGPVDALGLLGEPHQEVRRVLNLDPGRAQRLALLGRHDLGQVVGAF
jgi:hypothetical protein